MLSARLPARLDYRKLADQGASLEGILPKELLPRLSEVIPGEPGDVSATVSFSKDENRHYVIRFTANVSVVLECQNCLENYATEVSCTYKGRVLRRAEDLEQLEQEDEAIVADDGEVDIGALIEDELLLALPMVPRHADGECAKADAVQPETAEDEPPADTHRPFAALGQQMRAFSSDKAEDKLKD